MNKDININELLIPYMLSLGNQLYRVREASDFDKTDITQYGYIQDKSKIKRYRLNKKEEQVLYTSTYPTIAERETLKNEPKEFYLIKFRKTGIDNFVTFAAIDETCSNDPKSDSRIARNAITQYFLSDKLAQIDELRQTLEKDYSGYSKEDERRYLESSELASKILGSADCILTYSRADDDKESVPEGQESNRFLNVTLNKLVTDEHLRIETIYHCKPKKDKVSLYYDILEIGIPDEQYKLIEWYDWKAEILDVRTLEGYIINADSLQDAMKDRNIVLAPFVNQDIRENSIREVLLSKGKYEVQLCFDLHKKPNTKDEDI